MWDTHPYICITTDLCEIHTHVYASLLIYVRYTLTYMYPSVYVSIQYIQVCARTSLEIPGTTCLTLWCRISGSTPDITCVCMCISMFMCMLMRKHMKNMLFVYTHVYLECTCIKQRVTKLPVICPVHTLMYIYMYTYIHVYKWLANSWNAYVSVCVCKVSHGT